MRLYDDSFGGVALCEDEDTNVSVVNGLFNFAFDFCTTGNQRHRALPKHRGRR